VGGNILDIAPTALTLLGVEPPAHYEGQPWQWR
jgi:arylsulfatase A-like enzyme